MLKIPVFTINDVQFAYFLDVIEKNIKFKWCKTRDR